MYFDVPRIVEEFYTKNDSIVFKPLTNKNLEVIVDDKCEYFTKPSIDATVMGDNGKAYKTCGESLQKGMKELVAVADLITPNKTEAAMLLGESYNTSPMSRSEARSLLLRLSRLGPKCVVVTGVELASGELANIGYDGENGSFWYVPCEYVPVSYPGCGDIYASVLTGAMLGGASLPIAMGKATAFAELCVKTTFSYGSDPRYGVMLESVLGSLIKNEVLGKFETL